jgi:hypothetical protein
MVMPTLLLLLAVLIWLAASGPPRRAAAMLAAGVVPVGGLALAGRLRIAWPTLPLPLALLLNPYLLLAAGQALAAAGAAGLAVHGIRRLAARRGGLR